MMKPIRLTIKLLPILAIYIIINSCIGDIEGTFYISDEAKKYQIDTTIISFKMIDNYGITDEFYMNNIWYNTHHYFDEWGINDKAYGETFGVAYHSIINNYFFMYVLRADVEFTNLEIEWNQKDIMVYNFSSKKVTSDIKPKILFYDSLIVRDISYKNIIEIDYSNNLSEIDLYTPIKSYISGDKGLIKFIRRDNIVFERIEE